jgi:HK97 family phage portal protein
MGFISKFLREVRSDSIISLRNPPKWFIDMTQGGVTNSGQAVNQHSALTLSTVYSCVNIVSDTMAMMPLVVNKRLPEGGKQHYRESPIYSILHDEPNPEQTSFQWRKMMYTHYLLWGVGISLIEYHKGTGIPKHLWPILPWQVKPNRTAKGSLFYEWNHDGKTEALTPSEVVIITTLQTNDKFVSPISLHRETIGAAMAVNDYGAKTFGSGINPAGILSGVTISDEDSEESIRQKFSDSYAGMNSNKNLMILSDQVKFERVGLPPEDAQYLETKKYNVSEISRIFNVPLFMLNEHEKQTSWGSGIEEQKNGFVTFNILPKCVQAEQEFNRKLLKDDSNTLFTEFVTAGLLRGTMKSRMESYEKGFMLGMYSTDELRELESLNPLPDNEGKQHFVPLNMQSLENFQNNVNKE